MLKVGITGGIGSGKSIVCKLFQLYGIPLFDADYSAKYLMEHDENIIKQLTNIFGEALYKEGRIDRPFLSNIVFHDQNKLQQLNQVVHPAVIQYADTWHHAQQAPYTLKEAALFFESGSHKDMDIMIGVDSPYELRLSRAMQRDHATEAAIQARMDKQMDQAEKMSRCDYVILNNDIESLILQVEKIHQTLIQK